MTVPSHLVPPGRLLRLARTARVVGVPSPIGHALAGLTIAWTTERMCGSRPGADSVAPLKARLAKALTGLPAVCAVLAFLPDLDILFGSHRGVSHSIGGALIVGALAAGVAAILRLPVLRTSLACGGAVASHVFLDWLGRDTSFPFGIEAWWPFTTRYFYSGVDLFWDISRRYWLPGEFILGNLVAVGRELVILAPIAALAFYIRYGARSRLHG